MVTVSDAPGSRTYMIQVKRIPYIQYRKIRRTHVAGLGLRTKLVPPGPVPRVSVDRPPCALGGASARWVSSHVLTWSHHTMSSRISGRNFAHFPSGATPMGKKILGHPSFLPLLRGTSPQLFLNPRHQLRMIPRPGSVTNVKTKAM